MSIPTEAIEAAARAMDTRALPRDNATAALTSAAPYIQAAALRDAADVVDDDQCDALDPYVADWLRARADRLEGKS